MVSFGVKHKDLTREACGPGPASVRLKTGATRYGFSNTNNISIQGRYKEPAKPLIPAANHYQPLSPKKYKTSPRYSFGTKATYEYKNKNPASNSYTLPPLVGGESKKGAIILARREHGSFTNQAFQTPGAGTYDQSRLSASKKKSLAYSMTGRNFPPGADQKKPGANAYQPKNDYLSTKPKASSWSFGSRPSNPDKVKPYILPEDNI